MSLLILFRNTVVGTYSDTDTAIDITDASRITETPINLCLYNKTTGTPIEAFENGEFEIMTVTGVSSNTLTVTRGQEGTTAVTIDADEWEVYQAITPSVIDEKADSSTVDDLTDSHTLDLSSDGNFTAGELLLTRSGRNVEVTCTTVPEHSSASSVSTASGFIPSAWRPVNDRFDVYQAGGSEILSCTFRANGTIELAYKAYSDGSGASRSNAGRLATSYNVAE